MKKFLPLLLLFALLSGCASVKTSNTVLDATAINQALDAFLPPDFSGPAHIAHKNPYFDFTIDAGGLHRTDKGWTWSWLRYHRSDRATSGDIVLGTPPS